MSETFFVGASEIATLKNTFMVSGAPTDPTTVTLTITDPVGTVTTYTTGQLNHISLGLYTKDVPCTLAGEWAYIWTGTGTVPDVSSGTWTVQETNLGHLYVTPQMLRSRVGLADDDVTNDLELHGSCYAASRAVEQYCERIFWRTLATEARTFSGYDLYELELGTFNDLVSVVSLATDTDGDGIFETTWLASEYELLPNNTASSETRPYTCVKPIGKLFPYVYTPMSRADRIKITGVYGWPAVPAPVTEAARIMGAELFKSKDAPFGVASFGEFGAVRVKENPLVARLLDGYRHFNGYAV